MAFPDSLWINDRNVASEFKLILADPKGFLGPSPVSDQRVAIPERLGEIRVSRTASSPPRRVTVRGVLRAADEAEFLVLWRAFTLLLADEELELRFARWPDMVGYARYESMDPPDGPHRNAAPFTITFVMADPLKYARDFDTYTLANGAEVPLVLGTASSDLHLRIIGTGQATPTVYYKDAQGVIRGDVGFALTLPVGEWIDWNWDGNQNGVRYTTAAPELTLTDIAAVGDHFPVADPQDGDAVQGPSLLAVNCDCVAEVRKAWL